MSGHIPVYDGLQVSGPGIIDHARSPYILDGGFLCGRPDIEHNITGGTPSGRRHDGGQHDYSGRQYHLALAER